MGLRVGVDRRLRHSCRRRKPSRPLLRLPSWLFLAVSLVLFVATSSAAAGAQAGAGAGADAGGKTMKKTGLDAPTSDVITITRRNFKETVKEGTWFVKFYTDWCTHCQRLQPTWEELATELKGEVNVGQVNCDTEPGLCRRFHVAGYPTLVHVHNRRARMYKKSRGKDALMDFALAGYKKQAAVSVLKSPFGPLENFKALVVRGTVSVKDFVLVQLETGTPMWMMCLVAVAMLVVVTVVVAVVAANVSRPKQD